MGPGRVVVASPLFDDHLGLLQAVEDLAVEQLVPEARVEALDVAVLPGRARLDERSLGSDRSDPAAYGLGDELGTVIGPDVGRWPTHDEQVGQDVDDVDRGELAAGTDRQALAGVLVQDVQRPERPTIVGAVMDEVVGPDVVGPLSPQPDTGFVVEPQTSSLWLLCWYLQPLETPQALDPFVVDLPAGISQQGCDPAIAIAAVLARQLDHVGNEPRLVLPASRDVVLGRAVLPQDTAGATLGDPEPITDMVDTLATARGS